MNVAVTALCPAGTPLIWIRSSASVPMATLGDPSLASIISNITMAGLMDGCKVPT